MDRLFFIIDDVIRSKRNKNQIDEGIEKLESEFLILLDNLDTIELHTDYDKEFIEFRVRNALEMIKVNKLLNTKHAYLSNKGTRVCDIPLW